MQVAIIFKHNSAGSLKNVKVETTTKKSPYQVKCAFQRVATLNAHRIWQTRRQSQSFPLKLSSSCAAAAAAAEGGCSDDIDEITNLFSRQGRKICLLAVIIHQPYVAPGSGYMLLACY